MAVEVHYVSVALVKLDGGGNVINTSTASLEQVKNFRTSEHRIQPRLTGPASTANSANYPDIPTYLTAEATAGFALAYMDQNQIITQRIS